VRSRVHLDQRHRLYRPVTTAATSLRGSIDRTARSVAIGAKWRRRERPSFVGAIVLPRLFPTSHVSVSVFVSVSVTGSVSVSVSRAYISTQQMLQRRAERAEKQLATAATARAAADVLVAQLQARVTELERSSVQRTDDSLARQVASLKAENARVREEYVAAVRESLVRRVSTCFHDVSCSCCILRLCAL
jgi:hypothetical protein